MIGRRGFITGLISLVAAPAIVRAGSLMPVKVMEPLYGRGPAMEAVEILNRILLDMAERQVNPLAYIDADLAVRTFFDGRFIRSEPVRIFR